MTTIDWNLLPALDALLDEHSVSRAAARLGVTVPSMSRMLARLRAALGDPLLVRAGRQLVPTPLALSLRARVAALTVEVAELFAGAGSGALATSERTLRIRTNDGAFAHWLEPLLAAVHAQAPRITLAFLSEGDERPEALREGRIDLDLGVLGAAAPELCTQALFDDRMVGLVRQGHALAQGRCTPARLTEFEHVGVSRRGRLQGPIDALLAERGLARRTVATVATASAAAIAITQTNWVTAVPSSVARSLARALPLAWFELPLPLPPLTLSQTWHPRLDRDPAHRVLREAIVTLARTEGFGKRRRLPAKGR
jgi:DNA-binding transcriptional LysR family regulator